MKRLVILCTALALGLAISTTAQAQGTRMALVDVGYIFKNHNGFAAMRQKLEEDVRLAEVDFKNRRDRLADLQKKLAEQQKGSPDYQNYESTLARDSATFSADLTLSRTKFAEREAAIYFQVYQEMRDATAAYCRQNGIGIAMQFNGEPIATDKPEMVTQEVARKVIYFDQGLDITPYVFQMMQRVNGAAMTSGSQGAIRQ